MDARGTSSAVRQILMAHGVYLSAANEAEIEAQIAAGCDLADVALRTCLCGTRIDGFDAYWDHLSEALVTDPGPA